MTICLDHFLFIQRRLSIRLYLMSSISDVARRSHIGNMYVMQAYLISLKHEMQSRKLGTTAILLDVKITRHSSAHA